MTMMHDWILVSAAFNWEEGEMALHFRDTSSRMREVRVEGLREFFMQRVEPWGPSGSVNGVKGPNKTAQEQMDFEIEMQSGDLIKLVARRIEILPS